MEIRFVFKSSSGKPRIHRKRLPVVIGRCDSDAVRLRIPIDSVSRKHCEFFLGEGGKVCARDLGSTNGTLVNGAPIKGDEVVVVAPGSSVKVGTVIFRVDFKASKHDLDGDTVSVSEAIPPAQADKTETLKPAADADDTGDEELEMDDDSDSEGAPAAGDFAFLGGPAAASDDDSSDASESEDEEPAAAGDENLEDFFKGLK